MSGYIGPLPVPQATQHREAFTATASQTSFATAGYTPQFIDVYLNGVKLAPADYTATNGSDIVLTTGAAASDILEYVAYTPFEVADQTFTGTTTLTDSGAAPLVVNRTTSDGAITTYQKDGTTVGSIGAEASAVYMGKAETGVQFIAGAADRIVPYNTTTLAFNDGGISLGYPDARWSNAYLSGGVYLGGTGAANYLDDYEEGTFTPSLAFGGGATGMIYTVRNGSYTKVGDRVFIAINMTLSNKGSSTGAATVGGLPFVAASGLGGTAAGAGAVSYFSSMTNVDGMPSVGINQGDSRCSFYDAGIGVSVASSLTEGNFAATTDIRLFLSYRV
jgi:hypothetical protein